MPVCLGPIRGCRSCRQALIICEMDLPPQFTIEDELRTMGSEQLRRERNLILSDLKSLQDQIGDLAFNNYRTYADAGRTTQHCTEIFTEMKDKLRVVSAQVPELVGSYRCIPCCVAKTVVERIGYRSSQPARKRISCGELLSLPSRMDVCIRAGYYEAAYSLTNYGMMLQQHSIIKNPLIKGIADKLVEARSFLLEELFNKFSGPLDLASSIQVVNNVRKMPYLTPTQLRACILQHRDMYLDRQILDITNHPEFAIRAIEIYRDCMYDTLVLYLAVFPESETARKDFTEMKDKLRVVSAQVPELASELRAFHARTKDVSNELDIVQSACQKENLVWELLSLPSFTEMKDKLRVVSAQVPELASELRAFHARTKDVSNELDIVQSACQKENLVWELLSLPSRMDVCIRAGYYEAAYSLTNYGMMLQQHSIIKNPLIKGIADKLVEARSFLLEELFNKFSGPLDLASSIQVVNNVRKMPYLTPTQLRACILQHRDMYLDRQILDITASTLHVILEKSSAFTHLEIWQISLQNHPEFAIRAIEIYRDCMYDTLVLYLAVFPESETARKDVSCFCSSFMLLPTIFGEGFFS
ncbi:Dor1-like family protein [Ostertagia ostertagi]